MSDSLLAQRARTDPEAFSELYRRHLQRVYAYHYARTGNQADAQDLTSQTFVAALEGLAHYRGEGSFAAWLLSIARNKLADHYRLSRPVDELDDAHPAGEPPLEELAFDRLQLDQIAQALKKISAERAEALSLRIFASLSVAETARVMGKSEAAVKMLVHRALLDLKTSLVLEETL
jgi:RNA polymerase sigma-70 factor (ECF subfamily)